MRMDIAVGMAFSVLIMSSIVITSAGSLHSNGITDISTSAEAANALEPLVKTFPNSGKIAEAIFVLGIIGTILLAVPVLAGASAYAISDTFGWKQGLGMRFKQAKPFYLMIAIYHSRVGDKFCWYRPNQSADIHCSYKRNYHSSNSLCNPKDSEWTRKYLKTKLMVWDLIYRGGLHL
jgi:hypothetical protein